MRFKSLATALVLVWLALATAQSSQPVPAIPVVSGFVDRSIEIEDGTLGSPSKIGANLYPQDLNGIDPVLGIQQFPNDALATFLGFKSFALSDTPILNRFGGEKSIYADWVMDSLPNTDPASLTDGIATGIIPGVSGTVFFDNLKHGHWIGARLVDGVGNSDQDVFTSGGKEDNVASWKIAPGSVGSSKDDITQVYIANTRFATTDTVNFPGAREGVLYLGLERRSSSGTTAFDVEFNQLPPATTYPDGTPVPPSLVGYIPHRSEGDVLISVEVTGSGSSGAAFPHIYLYHNGTFSGNEVTGSSFLPPPWQPVASLNRSVTPSAPWGFVNGNGNWTIGQMPALTFTEVAIPLSPALGGFQYVDCDGHAFAQLRTRSSLLPSSDMKDATRYFEYQFNRPVAQSNVAGTYDQSVNFDGIGSQDSFGGANVSLYDWTFFVDNPNIQISSSQPGFLKMNDNVYRFTTTTPDVRDLNFTMPDTVDTANLTATLNVSDPSSICPGQKVRLLKIFRKSQQPKYDIGAVWINGVINSTFTATGGRPPYKVVWTYKRADGSTFSTDSLFYDTAGSFTTTTPDPTEQVTGVKVTVQDQVTESSIPSNGYKPITIGI